MKRKAAKSKPKARKSMFDDPEACLGPDTSPLYKQNLNLQDIIGHPDARDTIGDSPLRAEDSQRAIRDFKDDGFSGRHDPEWLKQALEASGNRLAGFYDEYLDAQFKETYGDEREELSDTESEGGASGGINELMDLDHASPSKKGDAIDERPGDEKAPSLLLSNGTTELDMNGSSHPMDQQDMEHDTKGVDPSADETDASPIITEPEAILISASVPETPLASLSRPAHQSASNATTSQEGQTSSI